MSPSLPLPPKNTKQDYLSHCHDDFRRAFHALLLLPSPASTEADEVEDAPLPLLKLYAPALSSKEGKGVVQGTWPEALVRAIRDQCEVGRLWLAVMRV